MAIIKVLCAEDDRLMRLEMKEKMTAKGWEVIEAVDGKEAAFIVCTIAFTRLALRHFCMKGA